VVFLKKLTYKESGVDIDEEEKAIKELLLQITSERTGIGKPLGGHYAGMISFGEFALVLCTDGVGSKVLLATRMKKWDTIGIDCIAMNVNDAICMGAEPLAFVDYLALDHPNPLLTKEIGKGLQTGAGMSNISIIGGETASLPEIINGFDLAGTCLAYVKKKNIITGEDIGVGDGIIGIESSGVHSNGFTLARKIIEASTFEFEDNFPNDSYPGKTIGEILLTPTQIYVKEIIALIKKIPVHGLAHITGGGLRNLKRLKKNVKFVLIDPIEPLPIFSFMQKEGGVDTKEMYQTFNMGMGFCIVVDVDMIDQTLEILNKHSSMKCKQVGTVKEGTGVTVPSLSLEY
jgi:phosphoribosylformylglycinamidine cyclo-ligase